MDRKDGREGEVAASRERLSDIAAELARRAQPEYVKAQAKEVAREKVDELKGRARVVAQDKFDGMKETAMQSKGTSFLGAVIGGAMGFAITKFLQDRARGGVEYRGFGPYSGYREVGYGFEGTQPRSDSVKDKFADVKSQASDKLDDVKSRASDMVDSAKEKVSDVADRISSEARDLRQRIPATDELKTKASGVVEDDPIIVGLGALAFGAIAGLLLPVSESERRAYAKVRIAAEEKLHEAGGMLQQKLEGVADQMQGAGEQVRGAAQAIGNTSGQQRVSSDTTGTTLSGSRGDQELTADGDGAQLAGDESDAVTEEEGFTNHPHTDDDNLPSVH